MAGGIDTYLRSLSDGTVELCGVFYAASPSSAPDAELPTHPLHFDLDGRDETF